MRRGAAGFLWPGKFQRPWPSHSLLHSCSESFLAYVAFSAGNTISQDARYCRQPPKPSTATFWMVRPRQELLGQQYSGSSEGSSRAAEEWPPTLLVSTPRILGGCACWHWDQSHFLAFFSMLFGFRGWCVYILRMRFSPILIYICSWWNLPLDYGLWLPAIFSFQGCY